MNTSAVLTHSRVHSGPIWVMNVDGLVEQKPEELRKATDYLWRWSYMISRTLSSAQGQGLPAQARIVVSRATAVEATGSPPLAASYANYAITNVPAAAIVPADDRFLNLTREFKTLTPLNSFTKDHFDRMVRASFSTPAN